MIRYLCVWWALVGTITNLRFRYKAGNLTSRAKGSTPYTRCLTKRHAMKRYGGVEIQLHEFLTSVLDGNGRYTPAERAPSTHWKEGQMGPRVGSDAVAKRIGNWDPGSSVVQRWATGWMIGSSSPDREWEFFSTPPRTDRLWSPPSLLSDGYQGLFPWG
jgi:hypothetical protein